MKLKHHSGFDVSEELLEAIRTFPVHREVEHCGVRMMVPPFDFYADCKQCGGARRRSGPFRRAVRSRTSSMRSLESDEPPVGSGRSSAETDSPQR